MTLFARNQTVDPFTDPKHDINNPLRYIPSNTATTIGVVFFGAIALALAVRTFLGRWRARYMLSMVIGCFTMTAGLALRYPLAHHPDSIGLYIIEDLLVVLSPCAFIAANYALLGRLARQTRTGQYTLIRPTRITKVFIGSDVATFLLQAAGGSLSTSKKSGTIKLGNTLFKVGIIAQFASYVVFTLMFLLWVWRVRVNAPGQWSISRRYRVDGTPVGVYHWYSDWRALAGALAISCLGIIVRSVYRTLESLQGYHGSLATNEHTFYALDTAPLWLAVGIYAIFWPGSFIDFDRLNSPDVESELKTTEYGVNTPSTR